MPEAARPIVRVVQITDLHTLSSDKETLAGVDTWACYEAVLALAEKHRWPPDLILFTGDLAQDPCPESYRRLLDSFGKLAAPAVCLAGNHDDAEMMERILNRGSVSCRHQILLGNWQIICLNSRMPGEEGGHLAAAELEKLAACLEAFPDRPALVTLHHHPVPVGSRWLDRMLVDNRRDFFEVLDHHPQVRAVLCGHIHQTLDTRRGDLRILGTPSTCFQFKPGSIAFALDDAAPGYRWLHLHPDGAIATGVERLAVLPQGLNLATAGY